MRGMFADLSVSHALAWRLFVRNVSAQYRQTIVGYVYAFAPPVLTTLIFVFLNSQNIFHLADTSIPYPVYVAVGSVLWQTFVDSVNGPVLTVMASGPMLTKINFPKEALVLSCFYEVIFNLAIRVVILLPMFPWFHVGIPGTIVLAPFGMLLLIALGLTVGIIATPWGILFHDVGKSVGLVTSAWFFLTPVVYVPPVKWPASLLMQFNPVSALLDTTRRWMVSAGPASPDAHFFLVSCLTLVFFFAAWVVCRLAIPHLIERMSA